MSQLERPRVLLRIVGGLLRLLLLLLELLEPARVRHALFAGHDAPECPDRAQVGRSKGGKLPSSFPFYRLGHVPPAVRDCCTRTRQQPSSSCRPAKASSDSRQVREILENGANPWLTDLNSIKDTRRRPSKKPGSDCRPWNSGRVRLQRSAHLARNARPSTKRHCHGHRTGRTPSCMTGISFSVVITTATHHPFDRHTERRPVHSANPRNRPQFTIHRDRQGTEGSMVQTRRRD